MRISRATVQTAATVHVKDTKTHARRVVALDAGTVALLRQHRGIGPVLGLTPVQLSWAFTALCRRLGIEGLGLHSLRHFVGSTMVGFTDIKTVSQHLGHSTPATTMAHYLHAIEARQRDAADAMGALLG
jgi:integrase